MNRIISIPCKPVEFPYQYALKLTFRAVPNNALKLWPIIGHACLCAVNVALDNCQPHPRGILLTLTDLSVDAFFALVV